MKSLYYYSLLLLVVLFASCSDDNNESVISYNSSVVKQAPDFTDARDNTTYHCIQIGNQIWMAENLRYQIPGNSLSGCYTWEEKRPQMEFTDEMFVLVVSEVADDPAYEAWPQYAFGFGDEIIMTGSEVLKSNLDWMGFDDAYNQEGILEMYQFDNPDFYEVLIARIDDFKKNDMKIELGSANFQSAEQDNGGYVEKYGFLYSYEGAVAAVPEGWRLPTDEDWMKLETALGMDANEAHANEAWRGAGLAPLLTVGGETGFNALRAGGNVYTKTNENMYLNKDTNWYYWSSTQLKENDSTMVAMVRMSAVYSNKVWRGTSRITNGYRDVLYSVRCVKDAH